MKIHTPSRSLVLCMVLLAVLIFSLKVIAAIGWIIFLLLIPLWLPGAIYLVFFVVLCLMKVLWI